MLEIDCRVCKNLGDDECNLYGKDCDIAVERCASDGFINYKKKMKEENTDQKISTNSRNHRQKVRIK